MSPEELRFVWSTAAGLGVGGLIAAVVAYLVFKHYLPGYLMEKGKNLAMKEDIAKLTREVEEVKHEYAAVLKALDAKQQLRMAAIDKRLQAHQEGYVHWMKLVKGTAGGDIQKIGQECLDWLDANMLYLEVPARIAIRRAAVASMARPEVMSRRKTFRAPPPDVAEAILGNWAQIEGAGTKILESVQLPALVEEELPKEPEA